MSIGYACLTIGVPGTNLSRCILKNATESNLRKITIANLSALEAMIDYNIENHIQLFRISSDIIPFASHPVNQIDWWEDYKDIFRRIGKKITDGRMRVSMHPGQYTVINSLDEKVVYNAIRELEYHNRFLDTLGMDRSSKLILHIGGVYGDKKKAMEAFIKNYAKLDKSIRDRLVIENDDKNYTIQEVLAISKETGAPVVFDNLHHEVNPPEKIHSEEEWIQECAKTWRKDDGKQKLHYSLQKEGASAGSHSNTIYVSPFLKFYDHLPDQNIDLMLEVKDKNLSAVKCINITTKEVPIESLKREWDRYKLLILSRSKSLYQEMERVLHQKDENTARTFYQMLEQIEAIPTNREEETHVATMIWEEYYREDCTSMEQKLYEKLLQEYRNKNGSLQLLKNHLLRCAQRRNYYFLTESLYFYL